MMAVIAWNPLGFLFIEAPPKGRILNAEYYRDNIHPELIPLLTGTGERQLVIHADNTRPALLKNVESPNTDLVGPKNQQPQELRSGELGR
jgi:hypothetical protein